MLRQAQHEGLDYPFTLSLSKGEERFRLKVCCSKA